MGFSTIDFLTRSRDGENFVLAEPVTFTPENGEAIVMPIGTTSDGASTPRLIWAGLPPGGIYWPACFLHDYLYRRTQLPKQRCDDLLMEAMVDTNVPDLEAEAIYRGVDLGGHTAFAADRAAQKLQPSA